MVNKLARLKEQLSFGVSPAMATPVVDEAGRVAVDVVPLLVDFLVHRGVKGLFVGGTTGEGILLAQDQRRVLHETAVSAAKGRAAVLVHVGAMPTAVAVDLARHAADIDADAMVAVTPYFYGMHNDGLMAFYAALADAAPDTPLFAYDIPHMAGNGIGPDLAARLFREIPMMAGLKSSNRDLQAVQRLRQAVPADRLLLVGNESIALEALALGADGMISGLSTAVPEPFVAMTRAFGAGDLAEAGRQQDLIAQLLPLLAPGARIGAIKATLAARGIPVGPPIAPLPAADASTWPAMEALLAA
jgi:dihydrodipicolinate synthase/N-acetylneuraminate lyase